ncbi:MAG TPA: HGxxPAAW family protein [Actinomycetales bacterium]|nr:HGxxPAAW family protein [Actinomycetales bacterium]
MSNSPENEDTLDAPVEAGASTASILPPRLPDPQQGHSIAAWTTVLIVLLGAIFGAVGLVFSLHWLAWTGLGVAIFGVIIGKVLQAMGFGQVSDQKK